MMTLLLMVGFVFGGVFSFFNNVHTRTMEIEAEKSDSSTKEMN